MTACKQNCAKIAGKALLAYQVYDEATEISGGLKRGNSVAYETSHTCVKYGLGAAPLHAAVGREMACASTDVLWNEISHFRFRWLGCTDQSVYQDMVRCAREGR